MCDYSLEAFQSRKAEVGDKLQISQYVHGFIRPQEETAYIKSNGGINLCLTCLGETGTKLMVTTPAHLGGKSHEVTYERIERGDWHDWLVGVTLGRLRIAELRHGTTAEVISIPSQIKPAPTLDERLGVDKINAHLTQGDEPKADPASETGIVRRVLDRVMGH